MSGLDFNIIDKYIISAIEEDITSEDITTNSILKKEVLGTCDLICKEDGILSGLDVFKRVFKIIGSVSVESGYKDGDFIKNGETIAIIKGDIRKILEGERTALNYLQRMCGIATLTRQYVDRLSNTSTKVLDTRKTTPNMRVFEKYSVKVGGGNNHRYNLSDAVMLKDNHIAAAGGIEEAVKMCRNNISFVNKIEVEAENLNMVREALEAKADIIMLDNMSIQEMKEAVEIIGDRAITESSGNITLDNIFEVAKTGVNYISVGALTHSAPILDLSMKNLKNIEILSE